MLCYNRSMSKILSLLLLALAACQPIGDLVPNPPGMENVTMYSGYLKTLSDSRKLHYIMIYSESKTPALDPLVMWLNGGPGCSSLLGMLQEIGPYLVGNNYTDGMPLTRNPYSWTRNANVVFLESPAGVGYSINTDHNYKYTDENTADDAYAALKDLLTTKFPNFRNSKFFISGESYAGKYIPDLAKRILDDKSFVINLQGILVGNGVMSFENDELHKSSIQYMYDHDFIGPHLMEIYTQSCLKDYQSPRCKFFNLEFHELRKNLNSYYVYEVCTSQTSEGSVLNRFVEGKAINRTTSAPQLNDILECPNDNGIIEYLRINRDVLKNQNPLEWTPCASLMYTIDDRGSIAEYKRILLNRAVRVWLYNGDWDDVVPLTDTIKNLGKMNIRPNGPYTPWFVGEDHAGFYQEYNGLTVVIVKGAGHMVPETKKEASFQMLYNFINNRKPDVPVS